MNHFSVLLMNISQLNVKIQTPWHEKIPNLIINKFLQFMSSSGLWVMKKMTCNLLVHQVFHFLPEDRWFQVCPTKNHMCSVQLLETLLPRELSFICLFKVLKNGFNGLFWGKKLVTLKIQWQRCDKHVTTVHFLLFFLFIKWIDDDGKMDSAI